MFLFLFIYQNLDICVYILGKGVTTFACSIDEKRKNIITFVALICNTNKVMPVFQRLLRANLWKGIKHRMKQTYNTEVAALDYGLYYGTA